MFLETIKNYPNIFSQLYNDAILQIKDKLLQLVGHAEHDDTALQPFVYAKNYAEEISIFFKIVSETIGSSNLSTPAEYSSEDYASTFSAPVDSSRPKIFFMINKIIMTKITDPYRQFGIILVTAIILSLASRRQMTGVRLVEYRAKTGYYFKELVP